MSPTLDQEEYSKQDRILNALAVYPERYELSNTVIAELTGASESYVYQLRSRIEDGELTDSDMEDALVDDLQSAYRDELGGLLDEHGVARTIDEEAESKERVEAKERESEAPPKSQQTDVKEGATETVSKAEVKQVRAMLERYRSDAEFERANYEGNAKNIAVQKYAMASLAVELLEQVIQGDEIDPRRVSLDR